MIWQAILQNSFLVKKCPCAYIKKTVRKIINLAIPNTFFSTSLTYLFSSLFFLHIFSPVTQSNISLVEAVIVKLKICLPKFFGSTRILIHILVLRALLDIISDLPKMSQEKKE